MNRTRFGISFGIFLLIICPLAWVFTRKLQGEAPTVHIKLSPPVIGASKSVKMVGSHLDSKQYRLQARRALEI